MSNWPSPISPKSRAFYVDTLGLQVTDEDRDTIYLRALEERGHHCIVLKKAGPAEARDLGFKVYSEEDLDKAEHFFRRQGPAGGMDRAVRTRAARFAHPRSARHSARILFARWTACRRSTRNTRSIKGVKPLRIDHFNCFRPMSTVASPSTTRSASA